MKLGDIDTEILVEALRAEQHKNWNSLPKRVMPPPPPGANYAGLGTSAVCLLLESLSTALERAAATQVERNNRTRR